jgi:hypothetical protein
VLVMGTDLTDLSLNDQAGLRRRLIGYVFRELNLLAGFTAIENVTVPLELDGTSAKAAHATGMKALALSRVPALDLAITVIGVPVAAALAGWLLAERRPRSAGRRSPDSLTDRGPLQYPLTRADHRCRTSSGLL